MVFRPELSWEFLSGDEIATRSIKAMRNHVKFLKEMSPYYKKALSYVDAPALQTLQDIAHLPLTEKDALSKQQKDFYAVSLHEIAETVITSGTTGKPLTTLLTKSDLDRLAFNEALCFHGAGITSQDSVQLLVSMDKLAVLGMAQYRGLTMIGANTLRVGIQAHEIHKLYFEQFQPTTVIGVPSLLIKLGEQLLKLGFNFSRAGIKKIFCVGESIRDEKLKLSSIAQKIESLFHSQVYSSYSVTEIGCSFCECMEHSGCHSHPELVYTEIVDSSGKPVPDGTIGELVATPFGIEGMPLLRYRTGDMTFKIASTCNCGRKSERLGPIMGRKNQLITLKGTTIYPFHITSALDELDYITDYLIVFEGSESSTDEITIHVVSQPTMVEAIGMHLRNKIRTTIPILLSNVPTINSIRGESRKRQRIIDKRKKMF